MLATALLLRARHGYRSFPSVDDFVYIPLARAALTPELYAGDTLLHGFVLHSPVWAWVLSLSDYGLDLPTVFWLTTLALSVATVGAADRLLAALNARPVLLPLLGWIAFSGRVNGLGRGQHEGLFGDAFHVQWLALCLLLWAYVAFIERRAVPAGALLGLAAISHPVVAAHGAIVLAFATALARPGLMQLATSAITALVVSLPVSGPLLRELLRNRPGPELQATELVQAGYLFRTPHEFTFAYTSHTEVLFIAVTVLSGIAGAALLARRPGQNRTHLALGLLSGHALLLAATVAIHGPWSAGTWVERSTLPFVLHLSRTSPLVLVLGPALALAAVGGTARGAPLHAALVGSMAVLLLFPWSSALLLFLGLAALARLARSNEPIGRLALAGVGLCAAVALGWSTLRDQRRATLPPEERAVYEWARTRTPDGSLFVIPPGLQAFRTYAWRSAYVDFKLFPASTPRLIPEWRSRLELVAAPDSATRRRTGWAGMAAWDSSYANRNTPERIAQLLRGIPADYFLLDLSSASAPPDPEAVAAAGLVIAYAGERFRVYRLGTASALLVEVAWSYFAPAPVPHN